MTVADDQSVAYERAVAAARRDPALRRSIEEAFLHEDPLEALGAFRASEHWARVRRLLSYLGVPPRSAVLDFGGGRALIAASLALDGYRATLCEINTSPVCGTEAAAALRDAAGVDFHIISRPLSTLPASERFDVVVCRAVLHHVSPLVPVLSDIHRVLVPGGAFVASDEPTVRRIQEIGAVRAAHPFTRFGVDERAYRVRDYLDALRAAGFRRTRAHFPVALSDYRRHVRPEAGVAAAATRYLAYRARATTRPKPGDVRSFTARAATG
jgi:SAM-dependent methyltransferase